MEIGSRIKDYFLAFFFINLFCALTFIVSKEGVCQGHFLFFQLMRGIVSSVIFFLFFIVQLILFRNRCIAGEGLRADLRIVIGRIPLLFLTGIFGYCFFSSFYFFSLKHFSAAKAAIYFLPTPIFVYYLNRFSMYRLAVLMSMLVFLPPLFLSCEWIFIPVICFISVVFGAGACVLKSSVLKNLNFSVIFTSLFLFIWNSMLVLWGIFFVKALGINFLWSKIFSLLPYSLASIIVNDILFDFTYTFFSSRINPVILSIICSANFLFVIFFEKILFFFFLEDKIY